MFGMIELAVIALIAFGAYWAADSGFVPGI
jgi:hypothetical protein